MISQPPEITAAWTISNRFYGKDPFVPSDDDMAALELALGIATEVYGPAEWAPVTGTIANTIRRGVTARRAAQAAVTRRLTDAVRATGLASPGVHLKVRLVSAGVYTVQLPPRLAESLSGGFWLPILAREYGAPVAVTGTVTGPRWTTLTLAVTSQNPAENLA